MMVEIEDDVIAIIVEQMEHGSEEKISNTRIRAWIQTVVKKNAPLIFSDEMEMETFGEILERQLGRKATRQEIMQWIRRIQDEAMAQIVLTNEMNIKNNTEPSPLTFKSETERQALLEKMERIMKDSEQRMESISVPNQNEAMERLRKNTVDMNQKIMEIVKGRIDTIKVAKIVLSYDVVPGTEYTPQGDQLKSSVQKSKSQDEPGHRSRSV